MAEERNVLESDCACDSVGFGEDDEFGCENFERGHLESIRMNFVQSPFRYASLGICKCDF